MACWWNATVQPIHDDSDPSKVSFIFGVCLYANTSYMDELRRSRQSFVPNQMVSVMMWALFLVIPHAIAILSLHIERRIACIWKKSPIVEPLKPIPMVEPIKQSKEDVIPCEPSSLPKQIDQASIVLTPENIIVPITLGKLISFVINKSSSSHSLPPSLPSLPPTPRIECRLEKESTRHQTKTITMSIVIGACVVVGCCLWRHGWRFSRRKFHHKIQI